MKKILAILHILVTVMVYAQNLTSSENYIYSRTYLEPVTADNANARQIQSVQYFDGLGRQKQSIAIKASPSGKDIAVPVVFDAGKQTRNFLPVPFTSQNGAFAPDVNADAVNAYYGITNAYSEVQLEKSPLQRIEKSAAPGEDWKMSAGHTQNMSYQANEAGVVKRYKATTTWNPALLINDVSIAPASDDAYTLGGYYRANTLAKITATDEDGNETRTYINGSGQKVLVRQLNKKPEGTTENLDTYYVYDEFGNLSFIIPPKAAGTALSQNVLDKLCYQYKYDQYNRLAEKKLPGKGKTSIVYDKQNRPVLVQDANLAGITNNFGKQGWIFSKYDRFGRLVYNGFFSNTGTRTAMQTALNNMSANASNNEAVSTTPFTLNGIDIYYTKNAFPTSGMTILSVNYYDEYPVGTPTQPSQIKGQTTLTSAPSSFASNGYNSVRSIKTLPTANYIKNIENDSWTSVFVWYDTKGRTIGMEGKNPLGGFTRTENVLDFTGKTNEVYTYHSRNTSTVEVTVKDRFVYSPQNYLSKHYQQINTNPEELLSDYTYDDLGRVVNKKVGNNLQSIDYNYNIRGWLTGINANDITSLGNKLFAYRIKYNTVDGAQTPNNSYSSLKVKANYNGKIAEVDWKTAYGANEPLRRYGYVYDGVNRLRAGFYQTDVNPYAKTYSEVTDYDLNGNIMTLNRTGGTVNNIPEVMDDLKYTYDGNRLSYIEETGNGNALSGYPLAGGKGQDITYDGNGNMISHKDKGSTAISYNFLNLPSSIINSNNALTLQYVYAADGSKVQMAKGNEVTSYLGNFQYTTVEGVLSSQVLANEEGYYDFINGRYIYQYKDHLGNIRVSYTKNTSGGTMLLEENNYYPFGLKHSGYNTGDNTSNKFKYLYNSKELQGNGNLDYGWRQYMPDLGRWNGVDQFAETYHYASPYSYVVNNPISHIDPDGRDVRPTEGGWEFTGSDLSALMGYLRNGNKVKTLTNALAAWTDGKKGGDFWNYFGSWTSWGGSGDSGGTIYGVIASDGAMSSSPSQIQELIFTRVKIASVISTAATLQAADIAWRQPGRAQMMGGDMFGFSDIAGIGIERISEDHPYVGMALGVVGIIALKKPQLALAEEKAVFYSVAFEMKLSTSSYPGIYRGGHFREANKALEAVMKSDVRFASSMDELGIVIPRSPAGSILGKSPTNWVWHHHVDEGIMQLVPKSQHTVGSTFWSTMHPGNRGGFSIWGK